MRADVLAVLCPGQGSQSPGMLAAWLELPGARETAGRFGELAGLDLIRLGTTASAEEITDTAVTQPLIVATGLIAAAQLPLGAAGSNGAGTDVVVAGHSVGEVTAAAVAGALRAEDAVAFAARRGAAMAAACAAADTGMAAVLGGEADVVLAALAELDLTPANVNGTGQVVAAGSSAALTKLAENPPPGARVRPLAVAGAFHTSYMEPAERALAADLTSVPAAAPRRTLLADLDGRPVPADADLRSRLIAQVTRPVRWDLCTATLAGLGVTTVLELPPAGTLVGLARRDLPEARRIALKSPDDLDAARAALAEAGVGTATTPNTPITEETG